ncbi:peptidoglycan/LPS O-acetylase OafA/YrhL [Nocardioides daedukensis]|uniref:Peptidoglycan/LPS O-acetylase OafA/YrhL n=1 Tax=Nocardioides daedukensis TaxID=634462 RepID=A0A7Y9UTD4_9ACTN|nr:peptidoglycan/LPS O-acetylase OafA/YrhL [Nocardioides daedukensis]
MGALMVLTTHTAFQAGDYLRHGYLGTLLARLDVGVAIFFVLSGFLLSRPWIARAAIGAPRPQASRYYERRLLRIYPVYMMSVAAALLLIPGNDHSGFRQWLSSMFMADSYLNNHLPHGLTQMWSLAVELAFYLILPIIMRLVVKNDWLKPRRLAALLVAMSLISVAWHLKLSDLIAPHTAGLTGIWFPAYLTWFAVGISLAWAHVHLQQGSPRRGTELLRQIGQLPGVCLSTALGLMLIVSTPIGGPALFQVGTAGESLSKHLLYALVGALVVITGVWADPQSRYARIMSSRPARHLGHISYSLFCIHVGVITFVMWITGYGLFEGRGLQIWGLTLLISLILAEISYRCVELPFLRLKTRVSSTPVNANAATTTITADKAN